MGGSGEKSRSKDMKKFFSNFKIFNNQFFLLENPTHWGLETVCPIFAKPLQGIVCVGSAVMEGRLVEFKKCDQTIKE